VIVGTSFASNHVSSLEPGADVVVVPGGVDVSLYPRPRGPNDEPSESSTADEHSAPGDGATSISQGAPPLRIAYVGELAPWQGFGTLLRALAEVRRVRRDIRLTLTGPGRTEHLEGL